MTWSSESDRDDKPVAAAEAADDALASPCFTQQPGTPPAAVPAPARRRRPKNRRARAQRRCAKNQVGEGEGVDAEDVWRGLQREAAWLRRAAARPVVVAAGEDAPGAEGVAGEGGVGRARSLTDDDLEELKGCVDLGFGFSYDEIPELCGTLPALELCYSMSQRFLDEHHSPLPGSSEKKALPEAEPTTALAPASPAQPIPNWKISSPGDSPDEVKARLKYWAQAVACTVRLCS
ncbi:hypothetical protein E2562_029359 [Oryza meyeriana var. granulata]|uniref:Uncharacterized protein n=1 Tax=Oryza meyeriana var. granulata TaxID=110450 RepID=A0A6G1CA16_9ORYZ|nr:hypothetical protein E2562_029359 [Oryza meyeriana var. granulata]